MARPKKHPHDRRTEEVRLRFTPAEHHGLEARAARAGEKLAVFLRGVILGATPLPAEPAERQAPPLEKVVEVAKTLPEPERVDPPDAAAERRASVPVSDIPVGPRPGPREDRQAFLARRGRQLWGGTGVTKQRALRQAETEWEAHGG